MDLTERKKRILRAIIESYIQSAEPVGSKAIAASIDMEVSSATIRNEMADLEAMGLLEKPHTSAGRIPSPKGYRLYVNELMEEHKLSLQETQRINQALGDASGMTAVLDEPRLVADNPGGPGGVSAHQLPLLRPLLRSEPHDHPAVRSADGGAQRFHHRGDDRHGHRA